MSFIQIQDNILNALKQTAAKSVETMPGKFDLQEVLNRSLKAPALFVSVLGSKAENMNTTINLACYVLTLPSRKDESNTQGIALVEQVQNILSTLSPKTHASNLYSGKFNNHNIGLWAITLDIKAALEPIDDEVFNKLDDFKEFLSTTDHLKGQQQLGD